MHERAVTKPLRTVFTIERSMEEQGRPSIEPLSVRSRGDQFCATINEASPKLSPRMVTTTGAADERERRAMVGGEKEVMTGGKYE